MKRISLSGSLTHIIMIIILLMIFIGGGCIKKDETMDRQAMVQADAEYSIAAEVKRQA